MIKEPNPFYKKQKVLRQMSKRVPSYTLTREEGVVIDTNQHDFLQSVARATNDNQMSSSSSDASVSCSDGEESYKVPSEAVSNCDIHQSHPVILQKIDPKVDEMTQMLITSNEKHIKREIGQAFLDLLQYTTYKLILKKKPILRTCWEKK